MKKTRFVLSATICAVCITLLCSTFCMGQETKQAADLEVTIYLKSGEIIKGKLIEKNAEAIRIEKSGNQLSFPLNDIIRVAEAATDKNLPAKYSLPFSAAIITYQLKGFQKGNETVYIDAVNNLIAIETNAVMEFGGFAHTQNTLQIFDGKTIQNIDLDKKEGTYMENEGEGILDIFGERLYFGRPVKQESFLGRDCSVYQLQEGSKAYFWNGILLKMESADSDDNFRLVKEATEIKLDLPIPARKTKTPEGIAMKSWDTFIKESQKVNEEQQEKFSQTFKKELQERAETDLQAKKMLEAITKEDGSLDMQKYYQLMQEEADKMLMDQVKAMPNADALIKNATAEDGNLDKEKLRMAMYETQREQYAVEEAKRQKEQLLRMAETKPEYGKILKECTAADGSIDIKKAQRLMREVEDKELLGKVKKLKDGQDLIRQATNSLGVLDINKLQHLFWQKQSGSEEKTRALVDAARIYMGQEQYEQALQKFNAAIELNPAYSFNYAERARLYELMGQDEKAIADLTMFIEDQPDINSYELSHRGQLYARLKKYPQAIADYTQALAIEQAHKVRELERSKEILRQAGESEEVSLTKLASYQNTRILMDRGKIYFKMGDNEKAIADFTKIIEANPDDRSSGDIYFLRGKVYREMGDKEKMRADWLKAKSLGDKLVEGEYVNGKKEGLYVWYYPEGGVQSKATYANDEFDGECVKFHRNGQMSEKYYFKAGKIEGPYTWYDTQGRKTQEGYYKDGLREGLFTSYNPSDGGVVKKMNHVQDELSGECIVAFWDNGLPMDKGDFKNGVRHGLSYKYYQNGQLEQQVPYENGLEHGTAILYNQDGSFKKRVFFKNGQRTGESFAQQ